MTDIQTPYQEQPTLLLVDDEAVIRRVIERVLRRAGYRVVSARNAQEALLLFAAERAVDVLLTDVFMHGMGGPALARELRARDPNLAVVYLSGQAQDMLDDYGVSMQEHFIDKPFTMGALLRTVDAALGRTQLARPRAFAETPAQQGWEQQGWER